MNNFKGISRLLYQGFETVHLGQFYDNFWNPINYAVVGGIGVIINYVVWLILSGGMNWFFVNAIAILSAWTWNWSNSVGPLGHLWGFKQRRKVVKK